MKLLSLKAENFRCFEALDLDLNIDGLIAVVGENGAGKSTIFAAIEWGMYGAIRGRGSLPARRDGTPDSADCWVEVHFEVGSRAYGVHRVDTKTARLFDLATQETLCDGRDPVSREVSRVLGLTRDMFAGTFYARQREVQALDSDDEDKRRAQVELLLGIERLRRATVHAEATAKEQRHLVAALDSGMPDVEALRAEAEGLAQEAAGQDEIAAAESALTMARQRREATKVEIDAIRAREREMLQRRSIAEAGAAEAAQQRLALESLISDLADAQAAQDELVIVGPVAAGVEALASAERELDLKRAEHDRAAQLRERQRDALAAAAAVADRIAALDASALTDGLDASIDETAVEIAQADVVATEEEIEAARTELNERIDRRADADRRVAEAHRRIAEFGRATELDEQLAGLPEAEAALDRAVTDWHALSAQRTQLEAAIRHDEKHRAAVLSGDAQAACPSCKRPFEAGQLDAILSTFEADLIKATGDLAQIDIDLGARKETGAALRADVARLTAAAADRRLIALPDGATSAALSEELRHASASAEACGAGESASEARLRDLSESLPSKRAAVRRLTAYLDQQRALEGQRDQAEREARMAAEDLRATGANGYDADAHDRVRAQLSDARTAGQRAAELRGKANGLELLARRLEEQQAKVEGHDLRCVSLNEAVAEVLVDEEALSLLDEAASQAERDVEAAHSVLLDANRHATAAAEALATANTRLQEAQRHGARLRDERAELKIRDEVATGLAAFREAASRRARPTLEHETGLLLGQTTRHRYTSVELTASYQLGIVDGDHVYPLRRFSGGEQDLAGLCLRLALSRALARQRGAETGFVMLDEVFGSQDVDRRRAVLDQLRAIADSEFRQVFVVSHTDDVVEHCDLRIEVARNDESSTAAGPFR